MGNGSHQVVLDSSGVTTFVDIDSTGALLDSGSIAAFGNGFGSLEEDDSAPVSSWCPHPPTVYNSTNWVSANASGDCWTWSVVAGCLYARCDALQGSNCTLTVNLSGGGSDVYSEDCGGLLKYRVCSDNSLIVCD